MFIDFHPFKDKIDGQQSIKGEKINKVLQHVCRLAGMMQTETKVQMVLCTLGPIRHPNHPYVSPCPSRAYHTDK